MELDALLVELSVIVDEWVQTQPDLQPAVGCAGRPPRLSTSEVLTLAVVQHWPRWRSERDFCRFADRHLRSYFPGLLSQSRLNCRIRALVAVLARLRASRHGCFSGEAAFGRCASKTSWTYGFKVGLITDPLGVITSFGVAAGNAGERQVGDALLDQDRSGAYLADKGFQGAVWEAQWLQNYGAVVAITPKAGDKRTLSPEWRRWSARHRQRIEGVFARLKDPFALERHRAKQLDGLLARVASKITSCTCAQTINRRLGRSLCRMADLLI